MRFSLLLLFFTLLLSTGGMAQISQQDSVETKLKLIPNDTLKAAFLNALSIEFRNSNLNRSLSYATQAKAIAEKSGIRKELGKSLMNIGIENYYLGNYKASIEAHLAALHTYEETRDVAGQAAVLNEIGIFNKRQGDTTNARINLEKGFLLSQQIKDSALMANSMNNLGVLYELRNQDEKAMDYYRKSAIIKEKLRDILGAAYNYDNMGANETKQKHYDRAEEWFAKAIAIRRKLGDKTGLAISVNNLGEMYFERGDQVRARKLFEEALDLSFEIHYMDLRRHIYNMISETWQKDNDYKKAFDYAARSSRVKDSIFTERQRKEILDLQTQYETGKKESEILLLKEQNEIKDYRIRQNTIYIAGLVLLVPVLLTIGYFLRSRITLKQKAELEFTRAQLRENQLQAVISSQELERKRFAADLHDGLGQMISALRLSLSKENPEKNIVDHALGLLHDMNSEIRNIAFNLMPQVLAQGGLAEALTEFAGRVNRLGDIQITVSFFHITSDIPAEMKIALYRICQEWVNNAMKYSGCTVVSIEAVQHPDELVIVIEDNGAGFDQSKLVLGEGNGWKNISSRLAMMKGNIEIDSRPGNRGTSAVISCPLPSLS